jgi:hypothetical protein
VFPGRELARLLLPVACPCGELDVRWCARCATLLAGPPVRAEHGAPRLDRLDGVAPVPVWALTAYAGPVRDVVVHWKDRGRADLDRLLAPALRRAAERLGPELARALAGLRGAVGGAPGVAAGTRAPGRHPGLLHGPPGIAVVPVPSTGPRGGRGGANPWRSWPGRWPSACATAASRRGWSPPWPGGAPDGTRSGSAHGRAGATSHEASA